MPPQGSAYDIDWVFSNVSNAHVANHKDGFTNLIPFKTSTVPFAVTGAPSEVLGNGEVELEIRRSNTTSARNKGRRFGKIILHNVLYAPEIAVNILGQPILGEHDLVLGDFDGGAAGEIRNKADGVTVGLLDKLVLLKLWLKGQQKAMSCLNPDWIYMISVRWPDAKRQRWESFRAKQPMASAPSPEASSQTRSAEQMSPLLSLGGLSLSEGDKQPAASNEYTRTDVILNGESVGPTNNVPACIEEEKKWLKGNFGSEYEFLAQQGFSIYKNRDREDGRALARAIMDKEEDANSDDGSTNSFLEDLESDPMSHLADHFFEEDQLDWIQKHFRHSGRSLVSYGLKPSDDDDCKEGVGLCRTLTTID